MTLKEKFLPRMYCFMGSGMLSNSYDEKVAESNAAECEQIADEFAIGFAAWCIKKRIDFFDSTEIGETYTIDGFVSKYKMNELLEIYKKEKGL